MEEKTELYAGAHLKSVQAVLSDLQTTARGLSKKELAARATRYGANTLPEPPATSRFTIFLRQFQSSIIYILLIAAAVVFFLGEYVDASIILTVLLINAVIGTIQEGKAEDTLAALKKFATTTSTVIRDGAEDSIPDTELVVGDILVLREGDKVGADARLIQVTDFKMDESSLTGESEPVEKNTAALGAVDKAEGSANQIDAFAGEGSPNAPIAPFKQRNMVFKGTNIQEGSALAVVTAVGCHTVIGNISGELSNITTDAPLKEHIRKLSKAIIFAVICIDAVTFTIGILKGYEVREMISMVVAMSVSAIPEGLPITVTLILAAGVYRMGKKNALVKKLQAVESLGQADVIATDKTGTLTMNQMMVQQVYAGGTLYNVFGAGYEPKGAITKDGTGEVVDAKLHDELLMLGTVSAVTSNSPIVFDESDSQWKRVSGDPTETALTALAQKMGFLKEEILGEMPLVSEISFSSDIKYHAVIHKDGAHHLYAIAGATEVIVNKCEHYMKDGKNHEITLGDRENIEAEIQSMAEQGLRVIALATAKNPPQSAEQAGQIPELVFVGLVGISDALRPNIHESVEKAQLAGIKVVMITGDYAETAKAIAKKAGIFRDGDVALTGDELISFSEEKLSEILPRVTVFARVTPEHKFKIVELYRSRGMTIGMTGDGVNDALSLAAADLGIAMGRSGTEVAKEAADIILLDDNFKSIVSAIEEGRYIYHSIKKVITYLVSTSLAEIFIIIIALLIGYPLILAPSQIIWLNFVTDGFLVLALAMEQNTLGAKMLTRPKEKNKSLVNSVMLVRVILAALVMMLGTIFIFDSYLDGDYAKANTMAVTVFAVYQWFNAWSSRSENHSMFKIPLFSNMYLFFATLIIISLQMLAIYWPPLQGILKTVPLSFGEWMIIVGMAVSVVAVDEMRKLAYGIIKSRRARQGR